MEIRCGFCGWDNPEGAEVCEKCHKPLQKVESESLSSAPISDKSQATRRIDQNDISVLKATINEHPLSSQGENGEDVDLCPECGYELENGICSNCGYKETLRLEDDQVDVLEKPSDVDKKATRRPGRKEKKENKKCRFVLTPFSEDGEPEGDLIDYSGTCVSLNRGNTDPDNSTITSQVQAVLTNIDGKWYVEDRSELKTTFVRAARRIELQNGDLILLGNQLYRFDDITY